MNIVKNLLLALGIGALLYLYPVYFVTAYLTFLILISAHEFGHLMTARMFGVTVTDFSIGFGPSWTYYTSKRTGIRYSLALLPIGGFVRMLFKEGDGIADKYGTESILNKQGTRYLKDIHPLKQIVVLLGGVFMNLVVCIVAYSCIMLHNGKDDFAPTVAQIIQEEGRVNELQVGDNIVSVDGDSVESGMDIYEKILSLPAGEVEFLVVRSACENVAACDKISAKYAHQLDANGEPILGFKFDGKTFYKKDLSMAEAVSESFTKTMFFSKLYLSGIVRIVTGELDWKENLQSPIGISKVGGDMVSQNAYPEGKDSGFTMSWLVLMDFLFYVYVISLVLMLMNTLPIPGLDGSHVVFTLVEWIRGKELSDSTMSLVMYVGMWLLFTLFAMGIYSDLLRLTA